MRKTPIPVTNGLVNDMRILRSQGKTNREIAQEMGLCIATVRRHIGNQPSGLRANYGSIVAHVTDVEVQPPLLLPSRNPLCVWWRKQKSWKGITTISPWTTMAISPSL